MYTEDHIQTANAHAKTRTPRNTKRLTNMETLAGSVAFLAVLGNHLPQVFLTCAAQAVHLVAALQHLQTGR